MHPPKTECNSVGTYGLLGHVKRMDGIGLTPDLKGRIDLSCATTTQATPPLAETPSNWALIAPAQIVSATYLLHISTLGVRGDKKGRRRATHSGTWGYVKYSISQIHNKSKLMLFSGFGEHDRRLEAKSATGWER